MSKKSKRSHKHSRKRSVSNHSVAFKKLYDTAFSLLTLQPWEHFNTEDFFIQCSKDGSDMILACTIDTPDDGFGVMIYPRQDLCPHSLLSSNDTSVSERDFIESEYYALYFDTWSDLPDQAQIMLRSIGVSPAAGSVYPWFARKTFGCLGMDLLPQDCAVLSDILNTLIMQYLSILDHQVEVDFEAGQSLVHMYNPQDKQWYNVAAKVDFSSKTPAPIQMREDSPKLAALRQCPESTEVLRVEFDFGWNPDPIFDKESGEPHYQMCVLFADRITGKLLPSFLCHPNDLMNAAFTAWEELIQQYGKPQTLYLSRPASIALFQDFADKLGIRVKVVKRLPAAQRLLRQSGMI